MLHRFLVQLARAHAAELEEGRDILRVGIIPDRKTHVRDSLSLYLEIEIEIERSRELSKRGDPGVIYMRIERERERDNPQTGARRTRAIGRNLGREERREPRGARVPARRPLKIL